MQKVLTTIAFLAVALGASGQSIAGANLKHWYDPSSELNCHWKAFRAGDSIHVHFRLESAGKSAIDDYTLTWESRESYGQRVGDSLRQAPQVITSELYLTSGRFVFPKPAKPWLLTLKAQSATTQNILLFFYQVETNYPGNGLLADKDNEPFFSTYIPAGRSIKALPLEGTLLPLTVFRYRLEFPTASPPFVEKENRIDPLMRPDSTFHRVSNEMFAINAPGLYLFQSDTNAAEGFCYLVTDPVYPKYSKLADLAAPLQYICTKEEHDQLVRAGSDKPKFDKVILEITREAERARNFMRNYFRRVELANRYFTSYKEGWKTDRGMIFTIFGPPDEMSKTSNNEVWNYKNHDVRFTFVRSASLYDPHNYVLVRDKRFGEKWFSTIDLWRKSRF